MNLTAPRDGKLQDDATKDLVYDFASIDKELDDDASLWESYQHQCFSQDPPVPALSLMQPILNGDKNSAKFAHQNISCHLPLILEMLAKSKVVTELDISDNSLPPSVVPALVTFVTDSDQLTLLHLADNPLLGPTAMRELIEGIGEYQQLESFNIANTGCNQACGRPLAALVRGCAGLLRLNAAGCSLRAAGVDLAQAIGASQALKRVDLSRNELFYGGRRLALQLGGNCGKCATLTRLSLCQNAITSEMAISLLKGLGDSTTLKRLDLSKNEIGEPAGRAIAAFIGKCSSLQYLDISQNPILNVTINKVRGQQKMEEDQQKPGGKKDKKAKKYVPAAYSIMTAVGKAANLKEITMIGLVADPAEWEPRVAAAPEHVSVVYKAPINTGYKFRHTEDAAPAESQRSTRRSK